MNQLALCHLLCELSAKVDELEKVEDLLGMLQHAFVTVFGMAKQTEEEQDDDDDKKTRSQHTRESEKKSAASLESTEETKLALVEAVRLFHDNAARRHAAFLQNASYQPHAALFIHELLKSLSGNSQKWYRQLQLESLKACTSILRTIGTANVRLCVPGVVSAAVRYINRAHLGKNTSAVRRSTIGMLQMCLANALQRTGLAAPGEQKWLAECVVHLGNTMRKILDPAFLCEGYVDQETATDLMALVTSLLTTETVYEAADTVLHHELLIAYAVLDNLLLLHTLDAATTASPSSRRKLGQLPPGCSLAGVSEIVFRDAVLELQKVPLLHVATFLLRCSSLRSVLINTHDGMEVVLGTVRKCVRFVTREMAPEDLYTHRLPRRFPSGVVDQFLECLAHALAELPSLDTAPGEEEEDDMSAGEAITNALMDQWETVLNDWDLYHLHPAAIYVLSRLVLWQFKPLPSWWVVVDDSSSSSSAVVYPSPGDFISSGAFEQLWGVIAAPHLWHITEDEDLCNYQQIHHRQVIASTVLRFLSVAAQDVLAACVACDDRHNFDRFCTLVIYLVMEKAATTSIVHTAAVDCLRSICQASAVEDTLQFYLGVGHVIVDEASRAIEVESLRPAAASVLRGAVNFLATHSGKKKDDDASGVEQRPFSSTAQLVPLVRQRLSVAEVHSLLARRRADEAHIPYVADFVTSVIHTAARGVQMARHEGHAEGLRASLRVLRDCSDMAAWLNFCTPQEALDEDQERQTTSSCVRVALLQTATLDAVEIVLAFCSAMSDRAAPLMVQVVIRGLTAFLTSEEATLWAAEQRDQLLESAQERRRQRQEEKEKRRGVQPQEEEENADEDDDDNDGDIQLPPPAVLEWGDSPIVLPRSHLKTVYRVYLSFFAMLREPLSAFLTSAAAPGRRPPAERRQLEAVVIPPSLFEVLSGVESLVLLATEFLIHRMIEDVLPVTLVWYERGSLPRIPTNTEHRTIQAVRRFAQFLHARCPLSLQESLVSKCSSFFVLTDRVEVVPEGDHEVEEGAEELPIEIVTLHKST